MAKMNANFLRENLNALHDSYNNCIALYIPSNSQGAEIEELTRQAWVELAENLLGSIAGGFSSQQISGGWLDRTTGEIVRESVTKVYAYCTPDIIRKYISNIGNYLRMLGLALQQQAVAVEINGEMFFISDYFAFSETSLIAMNLV